MFEVSFLTGDKAVNNARYVATFGTLELAQSYMLLADDNGARGIELHFVDTYGQDIAWNAA